MVHHGTGRHCLLATGSAPLQTLGKAQGTLTSTDKNLGAISQRGQHLISFKHTTSTCSRELAKAGRVFLKAAISGPIHPPPKL